MSQIELREIAKSAGEKFYEWSPCKFCGTTRRYVSTGKCCQCTITAALKHYYDRRKVEEAGRG